MRKWILFVALMVVCMGVGGGVVYLTTVGRTGEGRGVRASHVDLQKKEDAPVLPLKYVTLHQAVEAGDLTDLKSHLRRSKLEVNARRESDGETPLTLASDTGMPEIVEVLLGSGADINISSKFPKDLMPQWALGTFLEHPVGHVEWERTPLFAAMLHIYRLRYGHGSTEEADRRSMAVIELLLNKGADTNKKSIGYTPLRVAVFIPQVDIVRALLDHGADASDPDLLATAKRQVVEATPTYAGGRGGIYSARWGTMVASLDDCREIVRLLIVAGARSGRATR